MKEEFNRNKEALWKNLTEFKIALDSRLQKKYCTHCKMHQASGRVGRVGTFNSMLTYVDIAILILNLLHSTNT